MLKRNPFPLSPITELTPQYWWIDSHPQVSSVCVSNDDEDGSLLQGCPFQRMIAIVRVNGAISEAMAPNVH